MLRSEVKALGLYLSNWPENTDFSKILELLVAFSEDLSEEDEELREEILVWEPFENHEKEYVAKQIESAQSGLTDLDLVESMAQYIFKASEGHSLDLSDIILKLNKAGYKLEN